MSLFFFKLEILILVTFYRSFEPAHYHFQLETLQNNDKRRSDEAGTGGVLQIGQDRVQKVFPADGRARLASDS